MSCWIRRREEERQTEMMPWLQTGMTKVRVEALLTEDSGQVWGVWIDSIRHVRFPQDIHVVVSNSYEEVVVFSSAVKSVPMTRIQKSLSQGWATCSLPESHMGSITF